MEGGTALADPTTDGAELDDEFGLDEEESGQFALLIGGKAPTTRKVRLYGGGIECDPPDEGWHKGERYVLRVEVVCHKVSFTDERDDKTLQVVGCSHESGLKITGVSLDS